MIGARHHSKCAKEGCQTLIKRGWFCKDHWFALPKEEIRDPLLAAFNAATTAYEVRNHHEVRHGGEFLPRLYVGGRRL